MRLVCLFLCGFVTWGLVVARGIALEKRRTASLAGLIFIDECVSIGFGIRLARQGTIADVVACALGGAAAPILFRLARR